MATRTAGGTFQTASFAWARGRFTLTGAWTGVEGPATVALLATVGGERRRIQAEADRVAEDGPRWGARFSSEQPPDPGGAFALEVAGREIALPAPAVTDAGTGRFTRPPQPGPPPSTAAGQPPPPTAMPVGWQPEEDAASAEAGASTEASAADGATTETHTAAREAPTAETAVAASADTAIDETASADTAVHETAADPATVEQQQPVSMAEEIAQLNALLAELRTERGKIESAQRRLAQERVQAERVEERLASTAASRRTAAPAPRPLPPRPAAATAQQEPEDVDYTPAYWVGAFAILMFLIVLIWIF